MPPELAAELLLPPADARTPYTKVIRDAPFGKRLSTACDGHPTAPEMHYGRLTWLKNELGKVGEKVSVETVRKWFAGEARPRPAKMKIIAKLLGVDEAWLSIGVEPEMDPRQRKVRNAMVDGAVNLVAGLIQMDGGHPAFPEPGDKRATAGVDLFAIIKGAQYAFAVSLGTETAEGQYRFAVPLEHESLFVIGVVRREHAFHFELLELPADLIGDHKVRRGGHFDLNVELKSAGYVVGTTVLREITSFSERL